MASFRPFHPPPPPAAAQPPPPNQSALPPPPTLPPPMNPQFQPYPQHRNYPGSGPAAASAVSGYGRIPPGSASRHGFAGPFNPPAGQQQPLPPGPQQQYPYAPHLHQAPPPPPPSASYPPPPPPPHLPPQPQPQPSMSYPSSQYPPHYNLPAQPPPPPPPPSSPPPNPSVPPPPPPPIPPPSVPPPPPPSSNQSPLVPPDVGQRHQGAREALPPGRQPKLSLPPKQQKPPSAPPAGRASAQPGGPNGTSMRVETEEERRLRKRREYEKQKQEEKRQLLLKQSQATVLQKTQMMVSGSARPHGSITGSRIAERRTTPFLSGERIENRLKKPTTFICKMKFRNDLPDPTAQPKLLAMHKDKDRYTKYTITSLEKMHKPKLYVEQDLGVPLDLLDMSVYNPSAVRTALSPEDEELLLDDEVVTPIKQGGIRRKERPTDKGVSWLVKTQYISPISMEAAKMSLTEKQAKEIRESKEGRNLFLENLNNRDRQIQTIEESFRAAKLPPVHQTKPELEAVDILPLLPDFDRCEDQFVMVNFDGDPTADSEQYNKLDRSIRDELESQAIMKSFIANGSDPMNPEKFLAYMVPQPDELYKDLKSENEDTSYSWVREYHWDVRGDDADDPTTYFVTFGEKDARYLPLPTKLVLQKKKAKEGRSGDEIEQFPVPSRVTVRKKSTTTYGEPNEYGEASRNNEKLDVRNIKRGRSSMDDDLERQHKFQRTEDIDQFSGEEDMSD
nr:PREDICTED: protein PAF1 homolog [Musa acuminata subsp. malaccensis]